MVDDRGIQELVKALNDAAPEEEQRPINSQTIRKHILASADEWRRQVFAEAAGRMVSVKVDGGSRRRRSLIGINIQFVNNRKLQLRTLGVKEIKDTHTAVNIRVIVMQTLQAYGISPKQVYCITTDNGRNQVSLQKPDGLDSVVGRFRGP